MSKSQLKKLLKEMPREEMAELLLQLYDRRLVAKEYLDFYLAPDVKKLAEKSMAAIKTEVWRVVKRRTAPRVTRIAKEIKRFEAFSPGFEEVLALRLDTLRNFCLRTRTGGFAEPVVKYAVKLLDETIALADRNLVLDNVLPTIVDLIKLMPERIYGYSNPLRYEMVRKMSEQGIALDSLS